MDPVTNIVLAMIVNVGTLMNPVSGSGGGPPPPTNELLAEDGTPLLAEDGTPLLTE